MNKKLVTLARSLLSRTQEGSITWRETDRAERFVASLSSANVSIEKTEVGTVYVLRVENSSGVVIDRLEAADDIFGNSSPDVRGALVPLYEAVRSRVYRIDETLDNLLNEVGGAED